MLIVKQDTINYKTEPGDDEELARLSFLKHISDNFLFLPTDFHNYPENQQVRDQLKHTGSDFWTGFVFSYGLSTDETMRQRWCPFPTGQIWKAADLRMCWVLHRAWMTSSWALSYSVCGGTEPWLALKLLDILRLVLAFHEAENDEVRHEGCQIPPEFDFMRHIWDSVVNALKGFSASLFERSAAQFL